jgi:hypothetical protein
MATGEILHARTYSGIPPNLRRQPVKKLSLFFILFIMLFWPLLAIATDPNSSKMEVSTSKLKTTAHELKIIRQEIRDMSGVIMLSKGQAGVDRDQKLESSYDELFERCSFTIALIDHAADLIEIASAQDSLTEDAFFVIVSGLNRIASFLNDYAKLEPGFQDEYRKAHKSVPIAHSQNLEKHMKAIQEMIKQAVRNVPQPASFGK